MEEEYLQNNIAISFYGLLISLILCIIHLFIIDLLNIYINLTLMIFNISLLITFVFSTIIDFFLYIKIKIIQKIECKKINEKTFYE